MKMEMKINKSELMKKAWEIAREAAAKFNDSIRAFFGESLKQAWCELKSVIDIDALKKIGREWIKGDHHRIYFNDMTKYMNTENLKSWQIRDLAGHSVYYNVNDDNWYRSPEVKDFFSEIKTTILARI